MDRFFKSFGPGPRLAIPIMLFLLGGFAAPLLAVICLQLRSGTHFQPVAETGASTTTPTIFKSSSYISFLWSLGLAVATVVILRH